MTDAVLTRERILDVTEDVLRRFGLGKATVVDVARALEVSHGSVYRHFPSKVALRDAVARRWLDRVNTILIEIANESGPAPARLEKWLRALFAAKSARVREDPEMFATYLTLARETCAVVKAHKEQLVDQIAHMLTDGIKQGAFKATDERATARAIFDATSRFHHPAFACEWTDPDTPARIDAALALVIAGLKAKA